MKNYRNYIISFFVLLVLCSGCASSDKIKNSLSLDETEQAEKAKKYDTAMPLIKEALALADKGNYDQAIESFILAQEIVPVPLISHAIGVSYCKKKDYEKGLLYFYEALMLYESLEQEKIDQDLLDKLVFHIHEAKLAILREKLSERSNEMISVSIEIEGEGTP
jgi:tetratricopeptide (TPR) repeat protein